MPKSQGGLTAEIVLNAYRMGIFPMAESRQAKGLLWFDPPMRGILPLYEFHIPRSLRKFLYKNPYRIHFDTDFTQTICQCAQYRTNRPDSWINDDIIQLYNQLHLLGHAHSVEIWEDGQMVGGLYGLHLGAAFFGESMFSLRPNASKVALVYLVALLRAQGFEMLDTQFSNSHLARFGGYEIDRVIFKKLLTKAIAKDARFDPENIQEKLALLLQSLAQEKS